MSQTTILEIRDLGVRRGAAKILNGVSWRVLAGENWVILGANGSGKTSLLKTLAGYLAPTEGTVRLLDEEFGDCDWRELRERVGLVSSGISQMVSDDDTAADIVLGGKFGMMGVWGSLRAADRARGLQLLRQMGVGRIANRPWYFLSQGERQRVLIARALMADPRLLILDEPCAGLDPVARRKFLGFVDRLNRRRPRIPVLLVTHHVEEITTGFTHILLLRGGKITAAGPIPATLNSRNLSHALNSPMRLLRRNNRFSIADV